MKWVYVIVTCSCELSHKCINHDSGDSLTFNSSSSLSFFSEAKETSSEIRTKTTIKRNGCFYTRGTDLFTYCTVLRSDSQPRIKPRLCTLVNTTALHTTGPPEHPQYLTWIDLLVLYTVESEQLKHSRELKLVWVIRVKLSVIKIANQR